MDQNPNIMCEREKTNVGNEKHLVSCPIVLGFFYRLWEIVCHVDKLPIIDDQNVKMLRLDAMGNRIVLMAF